MRTGTPKKPVRSQRASEKPGRSRFYRRRDEAIREVFPDYEPELAPQDRALAGLGRGDRLLARRRATGRDRRRRGGCPLGRLPAVDRRDEHEAAGPQAARVQLGRPPPLRGRRHAEPARVRPGLLREGRRRARRREADRRPVQEPGLRPRPRARPARGRSPRGRRRPRRSACRRAQEEFYFGYPYDRMDLLVWGQTQGDRGRPSLPRASASSRRRSRPRTREIERRRVATEYLHAPAVILDPSG